MVVSPNTSWSVPVHTLAGLRGVAFCTCSQSMPMNSLSAEVSIDAPSPSGSRIDNIRAPVPSLMLKARGLTSAAESMSTGASG